MDKGDYLYLVETADGYDVFASEEERLFVFLKIADGSFSEMETISWFKEHCRSVTQDAHT